MESKGIVRVGRCIYDKKGKPDFGNYIDENGEKYTNIIVLTKSYSEWGIIGPYELKDSEGRIFENIYQASKVYKNVPKVLNSKSRWDKTIIW